MSMCLNQSLQSIINNLGEKHRIYPYSNFFSRKFVTQRIWQVSWLASCYQPSHPEIRDNGNVENNKLDSLQLRVQLKIFDFRLMILNFRITSKILNP